MDETTDSGTWCPLCGPDAGADGDGCCPTCGSTSVGDGATEALVALAKANHLSTEVDELWRHCEVADGIVVALRRRVEAGGAPVTADELSEVIGRIRGEVPREMPEGPAHPGHIPAESERVPTAESLDAPAALADAMVTDRIRRDRAEQKVYRQRLMEEVRR